VVLAADKEKNRGWLAGNDLHVGTLEEVAGSVTGETRVENRVVELVARVDRGSAANAADP